VKVRERYDLQRLLRSQIEVLGEDIYVLTEEFGDRLAAGICFRARRIGKRQGGLAAGSGRRMPTSKQCQAGAATRKYSWGILCKEGNRAEEEGLRGQERDQQGLEAAVAVGAGLEGLSACKPDTADI